MKEPTSNESTTQTKAKTGNCCGAPKMLLLISETLDDTNILTHGNNCHIDLSESQPESALEQTPATTQTGLVHVLANQDGISEAQADPGVTSEKNDNHLSERVAKWR